MLNHLVCGSYHHEEEDEACVDSPRKSRKSRNKNPYSTRGLDQFSALLADLDRKRQEIYSKARPQDISFIRFVSSNSSSNDFVPIVVKAKNKDQKHKSEELKVRHAVTSNSLQVPNESASVEERKQSKLGSDEKAEKKNFCWNMWGRPSFCLPLMLIIILGLLAVFGRSVATICTCILWYTATTVKDSPSSRKSKKKKHYKRGLSEKSGTSEDKSARTFGRQKSW